MVTLLLMVTPSPARHAAGTSEGGWLPDGVDECGLDIGILRHRIDAQQRACIALNIALDCVPPALRHLRRNDFDLYCRCPSAAWRRVGKGRHDRVHTRRDCRHQRRVGSLKNNVTAGHHHLPGTCTNRAHNTKKASRPQIAGKSTQHTHTHTQIPTHTNINRKNYPPTPSQLSLTKITLPGAETTAGIVPKKITVGELECFAPREMAER